MSDSSSKRERFAQASVSWDRVFAVVVILSLLVSWLGLLGSLHWFLDLFSHFRWQYLTVSAIATAWAAWRMQRKTLMFAMVTLMLNAGLIGQLLWHPEISREKVADDFHLRVLSLNVLTSNSNRQAVVDHVLSSNADVVFFMEVNDEWMHALKALTTMYPHHVSHPRPDNFGVALFSRIPWTGERTLWLGVAEVPTVEVQMSLQGHNFDLIGTHPLPPAGSEYAILRDGQLRLLSEHVADLGKPVLIVGDFNATPWSAGMRLVTAGNRLGFRSLAPPWSPTWRVGTIFAIPIDHALCTAPLVITDRAVAPDVGSDHRPLEVTVRWSK